jgi:hypothetical protein
VELALGHGAVTEVAGGHPVDAAHLVGQRHPHGERQPAADDRVAAVETPLRVEDVHRAAASATAPGYLAVHLGHQRFHADAPGERVPVLTIGGHDRVVRRKRLAGPDRDRLFADV